MVYYYISMQSENIQNSQQPQIGYTEYQPTRNQQHPASAMLSTHPVIISHQILQQTSPPESPRSLCSSSDESHQKPNSAMPKKKRTRTAFNSFQVVELEREYRRSKYMQRQRRQEVAERLSLDEKHIKIWFQNRRMRYKREGMLTQKGIPEAGSVQAECISNESSDHENMVKRFKSYSQDTSAQASVPVSIELHQPQLQNLLPPSPPPTESVELTEILDLLADTTSDMIATPAQSSDLSRSNITDILDYLHEPSMSNNKPVYKQSDDFGDILEYLPASSAPTMPFNEDSELSEILNYLEESFPTANNLSSASYFPHNDMASLHKIRYELELSAEAWRKRSTPETTIRKSSLPELSDNKIHANISKVI